LQIVAIVPKVLMTGRIMHKKGPQAFLPEADHWAATGSKQSLEPPPERLCFAVKVSRS
jgi:hypothetical protein